MARVSELKRISFKAPQLEGLFYWLNLYFKAFILFMHYMKQYFIDLSIIFTAFAAKLYASFTGFSFGIDYVDFIGKILYVLVMLITGFTAIYRFVKEVKTDKRKKQVSESEESEKK